MILDNLQTDSVKSVNSKTILQRNRAMENFKKLAENIDTTPLLAEIGNDKWKEDTYLRDYPQGPFGDTESIILRFPSRTVLETEAALKNHLVHFDQHENEWQQISNEFPVAKQFVFWLMNAVQGERLGRVMINKVNPGGKIYRHADTPVHAEYWSRFHIVIYAKPGNDFYCGDEMVNMVTGDVYYFRNDLEHEVINNSNDVRIHMVVDIRNSLRKPPKPPVEEMEHPFPMKQPYEGTKATTYQIERVQDIVEELKPFVPLHWAELGLTKEDVPVDMDWERYFALEREGKLNLVTVRKEGNIIGYQFTFVSGHFHYKSTLHGIVDLYYILPEYRKGRTGLRMFQFAEKCLKDLGVKKIITGCKLHLDHTRLFEFMGYEFTDKQFIKIIA